MNRRRINLNREWKFFRDDIAGAERTDFNDESWQTIGLPHTFDLPYFRTPEFYVGVGWYRKRFILPQRSRPTRWSLEFDGVFQVAEIFVNTIPVGSHRGGYTGFSIDITDALKPGENLLAIRVSNEWNPRLAPRAGEHMFSGGIYRDVHLVATSPLHVAWNGISITTPTVSNESATIRAKIEVQNDNFKSEIQDFKSEIQDSQSQICHLKSQILDHAGQIVATMEQSRPIEPDQTLAFDLTAAIGAPLLWHPDHPHLYTLRTQLFAAGELIDQLDTPFGIRWIQWTADRGFFLNGEHLYLRGANVHQDHAGWGIGITRAACQRDVRLIKDAGFNFIRGAHYPHHPAFADACDRLGVLFWSENAFWGKGGFAPPPEGYWNASAYPIDPHDFAPFEQSCRDQLREMIEQNRNHPSIIAWSMCNEPFFTFHLDRAKALLRDLVNLSRQLDPTRPAAIGGAQRGDIDRIGDIAGYNGDGARLFLNPGVPNMVSEYGAISKPHESCEPFFGELVAATPASPDARVAATPASPAPVNRDAGLAPTPEPFPWRAGEAIWCGFDYGSIAGRQGLKGICNHQRLPKQSWHWYRHHNLGTPPDPPPAPMLGQGAAAMLRLEADKTTITGTDAADDVQLIVTICDAAGEPVAATPASPLPPPPPPPVLRGRAGEGAPTLALARSSGGGNCEALPRARQIPPPQPPVTLTLESGPGEFPTGRSITFSPDSDIAITQGRAAIAFRSYHGGQSTIRATSPGLKDATIVITTIEDVIGESSGAVIGESSNSQAPSSKQASTSNLKAQTPNIPIPDRPYTPPPPSEAARKALANIVNVALNRPSSASSEAKDHPARFANDGDADAFWQPADDDPNPWWLIDLEGFYQLSSLLLAFSTDAPMGFIVETSNDGKAWTPGTNAGATLVSPRARPVSPLPPGTIARYVRIHFPGPVQLAEVEIQGIMNAER